MIAAAAIWQSETAIFAGKKRRGVGVRDCKRVDRRSARTWRLVPAVLSIALACAVLVSACGGGDSGTGEGEPATIKVGVIPIADVAPLYLGIEKGFFEQSKLTVKPQTFEGGSEIVTATVSGDVQVGFSNTTSLLIAESKNLPVQIISQGVLGATTPEQAWSAVLVQEDSDIKSAKDLEGKTVTVNTLENVGPLTINTAVKNDGGDYTKVNYIEIPFPDAIAALGQGRVDAIWEVEPFVSLGLAEGYKPITYPYEETAPELTVAIYFTTDQYIAENSDVTDRFVAAMNKSLEYAQSHPEEVRKIVPTYTEIPADVAKVMKLPQWRADLNEPTIEETSKLAKEYGFLEEEPSLDDLIRQP